MSAGFKGEELIQKAKLIMAVRGYKNEERKRWDDGVDYIASHAESGGKLLLRIVTKPKSESGTVGLDVVRQMTETMKHEGFDRGVLIAKRFTEAAKREMRREGIQIVSEKLPPTFNPQKLYSAMQEYIDGLCQIKCGSIPKKGPDCEGRDSKGYHCKIRLISDNASFHFKRGWTKLLKRDFDGLIKLHNS